MLLVQLVCGQVNHGSHCDASCGCDFVDKKTYCLLLALDWSDRHRQEHRDWARSLTAAAQSDQ